MSWAAASAILLAWALCGALAAFLFLQAEHQNARFAERQRRRRRAFNAAWRRISNT